MPRYAVYGHRIRPQRTRTSAGQLHRDEPRNPRQRHRHHGGAKAYQQHGRHHEARSLRLPPQARIARRGSLRRHRHQRASPPPL